GGQARLDAAQTRNAALGYYRPYRCGAACAGRFSASNRIDPAVCGDLSGYLLGKLFMAQGLVSSQSSEFGRQKPRGLGGEIDPARLREACGTAQLLVFIEA